jgi:methylenetetrahydrofolate dehydrogenase (NADP+)/methenyltetrahydrofolate cyclohydrolase
MASKLIDGKSIAAGIRDRVRNAVDDIVARGMRPPSLAVILVGDNPASQIYVSHKEKACKAVGITSRTIHLSASTTQPELERTIKALNVDQTVDGILLQLPLPAHLNKVAAIAAIDPSKDVDGLTPFNQGQMLWQTPALYPCTPLGVIELIRSTGVNLSGKVAAIVGRSLLVGMPVGLLLEVLGCSIIGLHSESKDPKQWTKHADILVVATGVHHLVDAEWVKPGAIVIDVGMHRIGTRLAGDVDFDSVSPVAGYITPVPGGVGPMTIAMLVSNALLAYQRRVPSVSINT